MLQAVVRRWLASLKCQREKWAVARIMFLSRMFATRWKLRARKSANLSNKGAAKDSLLLSKVNVSKDVAPSRKVEDFTEVIDY